MDCSVSPGIIEMFRFLLNAELRTSIIGGIKNPLKYVCKGPDRVTAQIRAVHTRYDEVSSFEEDRSVSASEAV